MTKPDAYKRARVLDRIRKALAVEPGDVERAAVVGRRLASPPTHLIPARARQQPAALVDLFCEMLIGQSAEVERVDGLAAVPATISDLLRRSNLPALLRMGEDALLGGLDWSSQPHLTVERGRALASDQVGLAHAFAGVAETGTLVFLSGADNPTTLNFLPETEVAIVLESDIVGAYEDVWSRLRLQRGGGMMPRAVNFVSGPSRTADIEQTLIMGAHGPRRLKVVVVGGS